MKGGLITVSAALALVAPPTELETTTEYVPALGAWTSAILKVAERVPVIVPPSLKFVPLRRHWYVNGGAPPTETLKSTFVPAGTVWASGWVTMVGGLTTERKAGSLTTVPAALVMTTVYGPAWSMAMLETVRFVVVVPLNLPELGRFVPLRRHW